MAGSSPAISTKFEYGPVAQLDRASVYETEGWGFESLRDRHVCQNMWVCPEWLWNGLQNRIMWVRFPSPTPITLCGFEVRSRYGIRPIVELQK